MSHYLAELTIIIGLLLLAVEVWLLGLSTIVLLATGCTAIFSRIIGNDRYIARNRDHIV